MLRHTTYEAITAGLRRMVTELVALRDQKTREAAAQRRASELALNAADLADGEAVRAQSTAEKLSALLS